MRVFNVEVFDKDIKYRDSTQITEFAYEFDYLDVGKNDVTAPNLRAQKGDYIRITTVENEEYVGIISDVVTKKDMTTVSYKPFHTLFDVDVYMNLEASTEDCIEEMLQDIISKLYVQNADELQNIKGLEVKTNSHTAGVLDYEEGIQNLYAVVISAFEQYGIVCGFSIDVQNKVITLKIGRDNSDPFVIESDLPNILEKEITIKEAKESVNKLLIYNKNNFSESVIYYKDVDDKITKNSTKRVVPVVFDSVVVNVPASKTFAEVAQTKAEGTLKASDYDNNIEITVLQDDTLVRPTTRKIGQYVRVVVGDKIYSSILTGLEINETYKLIFGSIRIELTKQLKRRWRNGTN